MRVGPRRGGVPGFRCQHGWTEATPVQGFGRQELPQAEERPAVGVLRCLSVLLFTVLLLKALHFRHMTISPLKPLYYYNKKLGAEKFLPYIILPFVQPFQPEYEEV